MSTVELIWVTARDRAGRRDWRRPSPTVRAVLLTLLNYNGGVHGTEIARRAGQHQSNVTAHVLPRLQCYGFVDGVETREHGHQGGGRIGREWFLTGLGRRLATAVQDEETR